MYLTRHQDPKYIQKTYSSTTTKNNPNKKLSKDMNGHFSEEDILRGNKREKMPNILGSESGNESRAVMPDSL